MRGPLTILFTLACIASCGGDSAPPLLHSDDWPEPLEGEAVLRWQVSAPAGRWSFEIARDGESAYVSESGLRAERSLTLEQMTVLRDDLLERRCCNLQGPWQDDAPFTVDWRIRMPGLSCDIVMPAHFFDADELAYTICESRLAREFAGRPRQTVRLPEALNWAAIREARDLERRGALSGSTGTPTDESEAEPEDDEDAD